MKKLILPILSLSLLTACTANGTNPMKEIFGANIVPEESNSAQVIISDAGGLPGAAEKEANLHCSKYDKIAIYHGRKSGFNCLSVPCKVYNCVKE